MSNLDYQSFSFHIYQNGYSETAFRFSYQDKFHGIKADADLVIKNPPSILEEILEDAERSILICHNITISSEDFAPTASKGHFTRFISKVFAELYLFCLSRHLPGVLILFPETEIESFTELQRRCLRDFIELFSFAEMSPKGVYRLYMPTDFESFQHYCMLHIFLEQMISSIDCG